MLIGKYLKISFKICDVRMKLNETLLSVCAGNYLKLWGFKDTYILCLLKLVAALQNHSSLIMTAITVPSVFMKSVYFSSELLH